MLVRKFRMFEKGDGDDGEFLFPSHSAQTAKTKAADVVMESSSLSFQAGSLFFFISKGSLLLIFPFFLVAIHVSLEIEEKAIVA